ncbi:cyclomaltodextrinase C-terminal domain-containing protein [Porphyromonas pogonae]|uniref:cyclomaltodextrinase C-terminal domain-containing protein n=2 Tax=Porphyromonas pogonae TaxID=867595 RepID=UPI00300EEEFD
MYGTKQHGDGNIRRDMPGGWHSDKANFFDAHGRSPLQNHFWDFLSTLLRWRRGNEVIAKGAMTHFVPSNGVYVYARTTPAAGVLILINGTDSSKEIKLNEYNEVLQGTDTFEDILTHKEITRHDGHVTLGKRGVRVLTWKK